MSIVWLKKVNKVSAAKVVQRHLAAARRCKSRPFARSTTVSVTTLSHLQRQSP